MEQIYQADVLESSRVVSNQEATLPGSLERRGRGWLRVNWKDEIKGFAELLAWGPGRQSWEGGDVYLGKEGRSSLNPRIRARTTISSDYLEAARNSEEGPRILPSKSDQIDQGQTVGSSRL